MWLSGFSASYTVVYTAVFRFVCMVERRFRWTCHAGICGPSAPRFSLLCSSGRPLLPGMIEEMCVSCPVCFFRILTSMVKNMFRAAAVAHISVPVAPRICVKPNLRNTKLLEYDISCNCAFLTIAIALLLFAFISSPWRMHRRSNVLVQSASWTLTSRLVVQSKLCACSVPTASTSNASWNGPRRRSTLAGLSRSSGSLLFLARFARRHPSRCSAPRFSFYAILTHCPQYCVWRAELSLVKHCV